MAGMSSLRVKICGLTNEADALAAITAGADALGFNFWPGSKRFLPPDSGLEWIARLPTGVTRVAVAVDPTFDEAVRWLQMPGIDALQLHGAESPEFCLRLVAGGHRVIKAIRLEDAGALALAQSFPISIPLLLDAFHADEPGGTGMVADWELAAELVATHPQRRILLAGGLNAANVTDAVRRVRPFGIDVASGVESPGSPRRKDLSRLRDFFSALQGAGFAQKPAHPTGSQGLF